MQTNVQSDDTIFNERPANLLQILISGVPTSDFQHATSQSMYEASVQNNSGADCPLICMALKNFPKPC